MGFFPVAACGGGDDGFDFIKPVYLSRHLLQHESFMKS
jgi:hypothetical protein